MQNLFKLNQPYFFSPDGGGGGGSEDDETDDGAGGENTDDAGKNKITFTPEQQAELNRLIGKTRKEEREKAAKDADAKAKKEKEDADKKALEEQGKFKELKEDAEKKQKAAETERDEAKAELARIKLQRDFETTVTDSGYKFVNGKASEAAFAHLDLETVGEDRAGLKDAVKKLVEDFEFYFEEVERAPEIDATPKGKANKGASKDTIVQTKRKSYTRL